MARLFGILETYDQRLYIKGIVSKFNNDKILDVPKMITTKNAHKCCKMITNTLDMIIITK
jgi:hypothetical protein